MRRDILRIPATGFVGISNHSVLPLRNPVFGPPRSSPVGSVVHDNFGPDRDLDVPVSFGEDGRWSPWDLIAMQEELAELFRPADLIEREGLQYSFRRLHI